MAFADLHRHSKANGKKNSTTWSMFLEEYTFSAWRHLFFYFRTKLVCWNSEVFGHFFCAGQPPYLKV